MCCICDGLSPDFLNQSLKVLSSQSSDTKPFVSLMDYYRPEYVLTKFLIVSSIHSRVAKNDSTRQNFDLCRV